jgi:hypothetical protein
MLHRVLSKKATKFLCMKYNVKILIFSISILLKLDGLRNINLYWK